MRTTARVGNVEVTAIQDKAHGFDRSWHYPGVPEEAWAPYLDLIETDPGNAMVNFHCFVVRGNDRVVLIDTGWGPELGPPGAPKARGALLDRLGEMDLLPRDIDMVAFTHLHADHVGWNLVYDGDTISPRFENARYLVSEVDWAFFTSRDENHPNIARQALPLDRLGVLDTFSDGHRLTGSMTAVATPGHTPGHTSFMIHSAGERLFILGDLIHHPVIATETGWVHRFDADPEEAVMTRERELRQLEEDCTLVAAGHLNHPTFGRFERRGGRRAWQPRVTGGNGS